MNPQNQVVRVVSGRKITRRKIEHRNYSLAKKSRMKALYAQEAAQARKVRTASLTPAERRRIRVQKKIKRQLTRMQ